MPDRLIWPGSQHGAEPHRNRVTPTASIRTKDGCIIEQTIARSMDYDGPERFTGLAEDVAMGDASRYELGNLAPKSSLAPESAFTIDVQSAVSPAFAVDMEQRIVAWNAAAEACFGYAAHEAIGRSCGEVVHACRANGAPLCAPLCPAVANARRGRPARNIEALTSPPATTPDPPRRLEMSFITARSMLGQRRVIHLVRDITDQHRVGESVARALAHTGHALAEEASSPRWPVSAPVPVPVLPTQTSPTSHPPFASEPAIAPHLTRREQEVLELLVCGMATHDIAAALSISPLTARNHVTRVMEKLGVTTRLQAVLAASRLHLV